MASDGVLIRFRHIFGPQRMHRFLECWNVLWPGIQRRHATEGGSDGPATLLEMLERSEQEAVESFRQLADPYRSGEARPTELVALRWAPARPIPASSSRGSSVKMP